MAASKIVFKLIHGAASIDLMSGRYTAEFTPPDTDISFAVGGSTTANQFSGSSAVSYGARNKQVSFRVRILGDSESEISRGIEDVRAFLNRGTSDDPVAIEYKPNYDTPRPIWGQDGTRFYDVVSFGSLSIDPLYMSKIREKAARFVVTATIKPYGKGLPQIACQAKGGIHHDTPGTSDGRDRGVTIPQAITNLIANPIFGHATFSTSWAASQLTGQENTDPRFILWGIRSVKLRGTGASPVYVWNGATSASTYTISLYVKRADSGVIDANTCRAFFNGSAFASTYTALGDGWYRVSTAQTGSAVAGNYGINVTQGAEVYLAGAQLENRGFPTALCHGDMYGCAWAGTAHNSSTTRTAGYMRLPLTALSFGYVTGSLRSAVYFPTTATLANNIVIAYESINNFTVYYNQATSKWAFGDGTNTIASGVYALSADTPYIVHATWGYSSMALYVNGVSVATGSTRTIPTTNADYLYIGTDSGGALQHHHVIGDFTLWGEALTAAQVLANYTSLAPLAADKQRISSIPYFWTQDGDSSVDTFDDNTFDNWGVFQGVPGNSPADVEYLISGNGGDVGIVGLWDTREFIKPTRILYQDQGGTVDAGSSGGSYRRTAPAASTETDTNTSTVLWTSDPKLYRFVEGREWLAVVRLRIASGTGKLRQRLKVGASTYIAGRQTVAAPVTYFRQVIIPSIFFPKLNTGTFLYPNLSHFVTAKNSGAVNTDIDFYCLFPRTLVTFTAGTTLLRGTRWSTEYEFPAASIYNTSGIAVSSLDLIPDTYNVMLVSTDGGTYVASDSGAGGLTFATTRITPRYAIL